MEKAYSLLTAPLPDDPDPEAWAPLYALYYAPDTVALLHLSRHGLSCALEAALSGAGLSFELRTAQVMIDGQDHPRRPEPIRRAVALADPAARREALEIAARHLTGAPRSLAVTIGWYFPPTAPCAAGWRRRTWRCTSPTPACRTWRSPGTSC